MPTTYSGPIPILNPYSTHRILIDTSVWERVASIAEACAVPWVLLSGGAPWNVFLRQVEIACASGASGVMAGCAFWKEAVTADRSARNRFLTGEAPAVCGPSATLPPAPSSTCVNPSTIPQRSPDKPPGYPHPQPPRGRLVSRRRNPLQPATYRSPRSVRPPSRRRTRLRRSQRPGIGQACPEIAAAGSRNVVARRVSRRRFGRSGGRSNDSEPLDRAHVAAAGLRHSRGPRDASGPRTPG